MLAGWNLLQLSAAVSSGRVPLYDFVEYWSAGRVLLSGGDPYNSAEMLQIQRSVGWKAPDPLMMWNPPWTFIFVLPFAVMPYWTARGIFLLIQGAALVTAADYTWRRFGGPDRSRWIAWLAAVLYLPCMMALYLGQINPLVLAGLVGFLWATDRRNYFAAGAMTLPIAVKPHLLYLFWVFLLLWIWQERRWMVLVGLGVSLLVALSPVLLLRPSVVTSYFEALTSVRGPAIWMAPSLGVALMVAFSPMLVWLRFVPTLLGALCALWLCWRWRGVFSWDRHMIPVLLLSIVTTSFCWMFDWLVLLPVVLVILIRFQRSPGQNWWLLVGLLSTQVLVVLLRYLIEGYNDFYTLWLPPALWLLYWLGLRQRRAGERAVAS